MKLRHLFNLRRYRGCRRLFRFALAAHLRLAMAKREPAALELVGGDVVRLPNVRDCRALFNWILEQSGDVQPLTIENGLLRLPCRDFDVAIPPTGEAFFTFGEVFLEDVYQLNAVRRPLGTVVDLGANIGLFATRVAPLAERVVCVEPVTANLQIARRNVGHLATPDKVTFVQRAVAGESGNPVRIFLAAGNSGGHSVRREHAERWGNGGHEDTSSISLDDLFQLEKIEHCSLLKCDVEGAEFEIFRTVSPQLLARIDRIILEVHLTVPEWSETQFETLVAKFRLAGFFVEHEPLRDDQGELNPTVMLYTTNLNDC